MTIARRLGLAFAALLLLFAGVVGMTAVRVRSARQQALAVAQHDAPLSQLSATIAAGVSTTLSDLRGWMILSDPATKQHRAAEWARIKQAAALMDKLAASEPASAASAAWVSARDLLPALEGAQDKLEQVAGSQDEQPAQTMLTREAMPAINAMAAAATAMIDEEGQLPATPDRKDLLRQMADFRGPLGLSGANMRAYVTSGDAPTKALFKTLFERARVSLSALDAHRALMTPTQSAQMDKLQAAWAGFAPVPDAVFRIRESGEWNVAHTLMRAEVLPRIARVQQVLLGDGTSGPGGGIAGAAAMALDARFAELSRDLETLQTISIGLLGAGLVMTLLVALATARSIVRPLRGLTDAMTALSADALDTAVPGLRRRDEIGAMANAVQVFKETSIRAHLLEREQAEVAGRRAAESERVREAAEAEAAATAASLVVGSIGIGLERLAAGDLTYRMEAALPPAYQKLGTDLNAATIKLQEVLRGIVANTGAIRGGAGEITHAADDLSRRTEQQAASLEQTAAALDEITATVQRTAAGSVQVQAVVATTRQDAERSEQVVREAVQAMSEIEASSGQVGQIIGVIDEIAFQTSLLALNAGVEAARAGDAGRGFAVVASEVRALAQRSADAARQIKGLIQASTEHVGRGVTLVGETGAALSRIMVQVGEIGTTVGDIAMSAREQATGLAEVNTAINQMDQVTQQNAAMVEQSTAASHTLLQEAESLARLTGHFQIGGPGSHVGPTRRSTPTPEGQPSRAAA